MCHSVMDSPIMLHDTIKKEGEERLKKKAVDNRDIQWNIGI